MTTVLERLVESVRKAGNFNANAQMAPAAILWPDKECQWMSVLPELRDSLPELFTFGSYEPDVRSGPAIWLKCIVARQIEAVLLPEDTVPIIYLPGVSRAELRRVGECPDALKPLVELQYRGSVWSQFNGKDWTINGFLTAGVDGLALDVARDRTTQDAMLAALDAILVTDVEQLENRRLEASDFNQLLSSDPIRDLLSWMNAPENVKSGWSPGRWQALCNIAQSDFGLDIEGDGELVAAEMLCQREGKWAQVWDRFNENPGACPSLIELLKRVTPPDLFTAPDRYWTVNDKLEKKLRQSLIELTSLAADQARLQIIELEQEHGERRENIWAKLEESPWAELLDPLARIAQGVATVPDGLSPDEMAERYAETAWHVDAAVLEALEQCANKDQERVVEDVLSTIYKPWIASLSERFQELVQSKGYPGEDGVTEATSQYLANGEVVFFVDGLRLDVANRLRDLIESPGRKVSLQTHWSALPSVTATAKAAVSPVHDQLIGDDDDTDFEPSVEGAGGLSHDRFKKLLAQSDWQCLDENEFGDPGGKAWIAFGDIDKEGHKSELKLAKRIPAMLDGIAERVEELLDNGWRKIRIVTDHGWLLVPGGLPKMDLPVQATESRWGRCAQLKQNVNVGGLTLGWYWNRNVPIYFPYGIHSFIAGRCYAHGGVSLQECLVPVLKIERSEELAAVSAFIKDVNWRGLTCRVAVESESDDISVDLRTKVADPSSSIVGAKPLKEGSVSLMVEDDENEGLSAVVVVMDEAGSVIAKQPTTVGGDD